MSADRGHFLIQEFRNIYDERRQHAARKDIMSDDRGRDTRKIRIFSVFAHAGKPCGFAHKLDDMVMIGMRIAILVRQDQFRPQPAKNADQLHSGTIVREHVSVRKAQILANIQLQYRRGRQTFLCPALGCPARSHFAVRDIKCTRSIPEMLHFKQRSADSQLNVIRMGENCKNIYFHRIPRIASNSVTV